jgi:pimeloyl-ACP methyl ester carboxylesterase
MPAAVLVMQTLRAAPRMSLYHARMYQVLRPSQSQFVELRHQRYHLRVWGEPQSQQPSLVMVHGWMDVAASFQFMVDAMGTDRHIVAPDWRGFGHSTGAATDNYWHPDYMADLDFLLEHISPNAPVDLLGHSMGGHVAMMYAGVRPQRVRKLINMEGFGMPAAKPELAPQRYAQWMDELHALAHGQMLLKPYPHLEAVAQRLMKTNPRLGTDKAHWLAAHWSERGADGQYRLLANPAHKIINAQLFRVEEILAIYRAITAPVLNVEAQTNEMQSWYKSRYTLDEFHQRLQHVPNCRTVTIADAAHMMHHDQPQVLAQTLEAFLAE